MKTCFKCGRFLPLVEFYAHSRMADGHLNKCRGCTRRDVKVNRNAKRLQYQACDRKRNATPEHKAKRRVYRRSVPPHQKRAWALVRRAVISGRLIPTPCEICNNPKVEAHHHDYAKPLDVRWLCFRHHREIGHGQHVHVDGNNPITPTPEVRDE